MLSIVATIAHTAAAATIDIISIFFVVEVINMSFYLYHIHINIEL